MASFNCARYIREQMESILSQLDAQDEVIVVDDASTDGTSRSPILKDPRISILQHERNSGVVATFEEAIRAATGDIIILSDCDDVWAPHRVDRTIGAFAAHPNASIVVGNIALMDGEGHSIREDVRIRVRRFDARLLPNLFANRFQGSAMAIRADIRPEILPFPRDVLFLHDAWIGARCALTGRQTICLNNEPLLYYRRHGANASGRLPFFTALRKRFQLVRELILVSLRRHANRQI